ncbi:MAG: type IV pilus modification protein PilV [Gammaproteobacteria bacterium]|jgi:type IV pilus assembly protein PilV|nr:type IV pilus modification protein PilV [Gammaproteobacteria bacterium]MBU0773392.1 type IV pilus modification protein PilV [Gammaproteobacteria bacterium]MBU0857404.1 type IV pilus modification protein PilV [Gammaproteobacteria bacterium]MBU1846867.1 type IV pilus modification protein PilV [Gammaproteobacteria bacterium]
MTERSRQLQAGVSLIEVLVALFVLAFGMLGIAGMQTMAMKANQSAYERNSAVISASSIAERMRTNQLVARSGGYNRAFPEEGCAAVPEGSSAAEADIKGWQTELERNLGDAACGAISCTGTPTTCKISIRWDDSRVTNGSVAHTFEVDVRI